MRLEEFLGQKEVATLLAKDYVLHEVHTGRQHNAVPVIERVRPDHRRGGIPWMAVLDGDGKRLITSDGPEGNCGFPYRAHEIAWFRTMLEKTRKRLSDADLDAIVAANEAFVEQLEKKAKQEREKRKR